MEFTLPHTDYAGYLFDCDGTLIDSMHVHYAGWGYGLGELGVDWTFPPDLYAGLAGTATHEIVARLNREFGLGIDARAFLDRKREYYLGHLDDITVIEPVVNFAREIARTRPVAVVTGGARHVVSASLEAKGLLDLFPVLCTHEDVEHGKPAPDMFLLAAEQLGVDPARCVVFEDGELGIQGARAAGMDTVFIPPQG